MGVGERVDGSCGDGLYVHVMDMGGCGIIHVDGCSQWMDDWWLEEWLNRCTCIVYLYTHVYIHVHEQSLV